MLLKKKNPPSQYDFWKIFIKNQLKLIREGSMSHHFYTNSIFHWSLEYLMRVVMFWCNMPIISSAINNFLMHGRTQTIETHNWNYHLHVSHNRSSYLFQCYVLSFLFGISDGLNNIISTTQTDTTIYYTATMLYLVFIIK